ncbi:MAG TPA: DUF222 domain-containing protein, partial [Jatrophihabitantaceae bacterium]|nr:DUF222 domain-containing protein [Jatrophihabitantaceae bacterium]
MSSTAVDPRSLGADDLVAELARLETEVNRLQARQLDVINALDESLRRSAFELDRDWTVEEISAALRISPSWAADRLGFARELQRMPRLFELLRAGAITFMHARNAAREMLQLDQEQVDAVLDRVLERAVEQ